MEIRAKVGIGGLIVLSPQSRLIQIKDGTLWGTTIMYGKVPAGHLGDGIVITPSHNPPRDGGFKYNPPNGGPADTDITKWMQDRANDLLRSGNVGVKRVPFSSAMTASTTHQQLTSEEQADG